MKKITFFVLTVLLVLTVVISSCAKGDPGPAGPEGPAGSQVFQVKYQNGVYPDAYYMACSDTNINSLSGANYGTCASLWMGTGSSNIRRSLIKFGALRASIPAGAVIEKAYLTLFIGNISGAGVTVTAHSMTTAFLQGTVCGGAATDGPNWATVDGSTPWTNAGGDYNAAIAGSFAVNNTGFVTFEISASTVQAWVDQDNGNKGLLLKGLDEVTDQNNLSIEYSETASPMERPKLTVYYRLP